MTPATLQQICRATRGKLLCGDPQTLVNGVSTNTKELQPGQIFAALVANRDGHEFIPQAIAAGAPAVLVSKSVELPQGIGAILVDDTLQALGDLAAWYRATMNATVIGVTGSNGKTTVKEMTGYVLSAAAPTVKSRCSFNNSLGVPHTLFMLEADDRYAVVEMGTSNRGEIEKLAAIARPGIGVILNVSPTHLDGLGTIKNIAIEKSSLIRSLPAGGTAILNADDFWCSEIAAQSPAPVVTFGLEEHAQIRGTKVQITTAGIRFDALGTAFSIPIFGEHNVYNALAAIAICTSLGLSPEFIRDRLATFNLVPPMRMEKINIGEITIFNDAYNANFASMLAALREFSKVPAAGRKVAVCGDMLELGEQSAEMHREVGKRVASLNFDLLLAVGSEASHIRTGALEAGMPEERIRHCSTTSQACKVIPDLLDRRDTILLKASRRMELERLVESIQQWQPGSSTLCNEAARKLYLGYRSPVMQPMPQLQ